MKSKNKEDNVDLKIFQTAYFHWHIKTKAKKETEGKFSVLLERKNLLTDNSSK